MTVDKIISDAAVHQTTQEKLDKSRKSSDERAARAQNIEAASSADNASLSTEARKLQETERILRFALERLEQFDDVRSEKLDEVREKLGSDFYFDDDISGEVSERVFSDEELQARLERNQQMRHILDDVHAMDQAQKETDIDNERLDAIRQRVQSGFYDSEEVLASIADRLIELTE